MSSLNGPLGGYVEDYGINKQGEIFSTYRGGSTSHISRDGGNTWTDLNGNFGSLSLTSHPDGSFYGFGFGAPAANKLPFGHNNVITVSLGSLSTTGYENFTIDKEGVFFSVTGNQEIAKSEDNGNTWTVLGAVPWQGAFLYFNEFHSPEGTDYIYADFWNVIANSNILYRIKKDGSAFEVSFNGQTESINNFCHDPGLGHFLSRGNNVYHSPDGAPGSWQIISSAFDVRGVICAPNGDITAAGSDGYFRSTDMGANWTPLSGPKVSEHPQSFEMQYNAVYDRYIIKNLSPDIDNLFSVSPDFNTWQPINPRNNRPSIRKIFVDEAENIYTGIAHPGGPNMEGWHRSDDGGNTFQRLLLPGGVDVRSITGGAGGAIIALAQNEFVYRSIDNGISWTDVTPSGVNLLPQLRSRYNFVKGHSNGTILLQYDNGSTFKLYLSGDNGLTWTPIDNFSYFEDYIDIHPNGDIYGGPQNPNNILKRYDRQTNQWSTIYTDASSTVNVDISPDGVIFMGGTYRGVFGTLISEDNGASFAGTPFSLNNLETGPNGYVVGTTGSDGNVYLSRNNGLSWEVGWQYGAPFGGPGVLGELTFAENNILYAAVIGDFVQKSTKFVFNDNYIVGDVFYDADEDCDFDPGEEPLPNILLTAAGTDTFYVTTRGDGLFSIPVPAGTYDVTLSVDNDYWTPCTPLQTVTLTGVNDSTFIDFAVKPKVQCPKMQVDLTNPFLRRCFENTYHVRYCNDGTALGQNVSVDVTLDPRMSIISATLPFTSTGDVYTFSLPDMPISTCERFSFVTDMICDSVDLGETICAEARIFPDTVCVPPDPSWNGASLRIEGECLGDTILFEIKNVGTGNMLQAKNYIIIEDVALNRVSPPFMLDAGVTLPVKVETAGQTWHMQTEQVDSHPGNSNPRLTVEKCGEAPFNYGFFNQFGQDDLSGMFDIECREAIGAYDPNDKSAIPEGVGSSHRIDPGTTLEYLIRFQNTGTDTAFNVVLIDTISNLLNISSFESGASSHDYTYRFLDNGVLRFDFKNIMLPDSNVNFAGSNGFVKYKITLKPDVPLGSVVYNAADIYFDFNDPIYTNQTFHLVDLPTALVETTKIFEEDISVNVYPNPFKERVKFELKNVSAAEKRFVLFSSFGKIYRNQTFMGNQFEIENINLQSGLYFYEILEGNKKLAFGKVVVE